MSAKRHERSIARRSTVQVLYTSEIQGKRPSTLLDMGLCLSEDGPLSDYALRLVDGIEEHLDVIDDKLEATSENWAVARMPIVDRSILRLATYEMLYVDDVPLSVSINEAVELAKDFGGEEDSPRFVNGVLGRIARQIERADAADAGAGAADASMAGAGADVADAGAGAGADAPGAGEPAVEAEGEPAVGEPAAADEAIGAAGGPAGPAAEVEAGL